MMYKEIGDDYYGLKLVFDCPPVKDYPATTFVFSNHTLLTMLTQSAPRITEMVQDKLYFNQPADYPVTASHPSDWLDIAQLLRQKKKHNVNTPKLVMDIGGRKITCRIPSDRYVYDKGELPPYVLRANILTFDKKPTRKSIIVTQTDNIDEHDIITKQKTRGGNPIVITDKDGKEKILERLSYPLIYKVLKEHYHDGFDDKLIIQECRRILSGKKLHPNHANVLPVMVGALYGSEVSRNRACLTTGIMLLDLIENKVTAPRASLDVPENVYCIENSIWHPKVLGFTAKECKKDPEKVRLGKLGGFYAMAHVGSWDNEFTDELGGEYQQNSTLTNAHIKSIVVLLDWFCNLDHPSLEGIKLIKLNKKQYEQDAAIFEANHKKLWESNQTRAQSSQICTPILSTFLYPLIIERLSSFKNMLPPLEKAKASKFFPCDEPSLLKHNIIMQTLEEKADTIESELKQKHLKNRDAYYKSISSIPELSDKLIEKMHKTIIDQESCCQFIRQYDEKFTEEQLNYYLHNNETTLVEFCKLFQKLILIVDHVAMRLSTMMSNLTPCHQEVAWRLLLGKRAFYQKFQKGFGSLAKFIMRINVQYPLPKYLVQILFHENNTYLLESMTNEDVVTLANDSPYFFEKILVDHPDITRKMTRKMGLCKIFEKLYTSADGYSCHKQEFWEKLLKHHYHKTIDSIASRYLKEKSIELNSDLPPPAYTVAFFDNFEESDSQDDTKEPNNPLTL